MTDLEADLHAAKTANHCTGWAYGQNSDGHIEGVIILNDEEEHITFTQTENGYIVDGVPYGSILGYFTQQE